MSNITGKIAKRAALGVLVMAAVAVAGDTTAHAATHHASAVGHSVASADNNNPGPDGTHPAPVA
jgi:hypothetical protein